MLTFAIVIPSLNQSHFLPTALESLKYQTGPYNLAVMDGGSRDNFTEVIEKYRNTINHLRSRPDKGQADAIRSGLDQLPGDIVCWLNADDYYFPEVLDRVSSCFEKDPELDVVYGDAVHVTSEGLFISYFPAIQKFNAKDLTRNCFICQPACFVRRSVYEKVGGIDPTLHYTMDWDLWCRLANSGAKFLYFNEALAAVRTYPGTKTRRGHWRRYSEIWRIERRYGRRLLPRSWPGFYFYELSLRRKRTFKDQFSLKVLNTFRQAKKKIFRIQGSRNKFNNTIYGFNRWEGVVERECTIHLPWYEKKDWVKLLLKVSPLNDQYRIRINDQLCDHEKKHNGRLIVDVPPLDTPHRVISIESLKGGKWNLMEFSCGF